MILPALRCSSISNDLSLYHFVFKGHIREKVHRACAIGILMKEKLSALIVILFVAVHVFAQERSENDRELIRAVMSEGAAWVRI
jgi:hypothetical protein